MIKKSYAKINLSINVLERLENNYHIIDMVMSKINLYDKLYFSTFDEDRIVLTCTNPYIPLDRKNLIYQVIDRIKKKYHIKQGIRVHIAKVIPMQAGLGGGSSNAACSVEAMDEMFNLKMNMEDKIKMVVDLGADIPFFFYNGMARVQGIGDIIKPFDAKIDDFYVVLVKPAKGISTQLAYENIDLASCDHPDIEGIINALKNNDYSYLVRNIKNSIQNSSIEIRPVIKKIQAELLELGVDVTLVSGSGSTVFALTKNKEVVNQIKKAHINKKNFVYITNILR